MPLTGCPAADTAATMSGSSFFCVWSGSVPNRTSSPSEGPSSSVSNAVPDVPRASSAESLSVSESVSASTGLVWLTVAS